MDAYEKFKRLPQHVRLVGTSSQEIKSSLNHIYDIDVIRHALAYEKQHSNRSTVIKMLSGKLNRMEKHAARKEETHVD